jgi:antitoxin component of RelBE/YafQ-DinJ toxin-antitoxin module
METLIMHPKNKEQLTALKAFVKAMKVDFETEQAECKLDHTPNAETIKAIEDARKGKNMLNPIKDIKAFLKSI